MTKSEFRRVNTDAKVRELFDSLPDMRSLSLEGSEITNATLELLAANCFALKELSITDTMITDQGLQYIGKLPSLNWLCIDNKLATDQGLRRIVTLPALKGLHLIDTNVTDAGFASLRALWGLAYLEVVTSNDIGAEGLRALTNKTGLEYLRLSATKIGPDKFSQLVLGERLRSFTFEMPLISEIDLNELNKKYPACHIERYRFQRTGYESEYEAAMRLAIERSPVPTTQVRGTERLMHTDLRARTRKPPSELTLELPGDLPNQPKPTNRLSAEEVAMLIERGLLHPDFFKYNAGFGAKKKR